MMCSQLRCSKSDFLSVRQHDVLLSRQFLMICHQPCKPKLRHMLLNTRRYCSNIPSEVGRHHQIQKEDKKRLLPLTNGHI